ncbi:MAG TPA: glycoside hydrolase family 130 protein [Phycisphaerae bacterium]|nr:glycoside hydrolase family 130 protein [Phycisphaerae bacterium]
MKRSSLNPILTRSDIPDIPPHVADVTSVFNPGAIRLGDRYLLLLRVQTRGRETVLMVAESRDGERFTVRPRIVHIEGLDAVKQTIYHVYDPRLTMIDGTVYIVFAADTDAGCRLGIARTSDFDRFEMVGFGGDEDARNGVLFPERHDGRYLRLERPNRTRLDSGVTTGTEIMLSESDDLVYWRPVGPVMAGRFHYWDELIGSGPPPVKTRAGWLHIYHGVATHFAAANIYQAGVVLLDLDEPHHVLARCRENILEPRELCELVGQVPNVVFPSGMIVEDFDAEGFAEPDGLVRVYYGAADTVVCLATTTVADLITAAREGEAPAEP